ncbi:histidine phosphatase family protein [Priestia endophytica]|uniref:histidine phosphatase family protein n=1 Tax=Priestia endophytica TaxID=135735 RepID=UPI000FA8CC86|nr:histidine phosphatase family protein [Priestia endophytica]RPK12592.1 hypothetical protein FH5_02798 [Priestia endophytica]
MTKKGAKNMLYLVRHGQTDWNKNGLVQGQTDIPLNSTGVEQAQALAKRFQKENIDVIYASDLKRAYGTAEEIAKVKNMRVSEGLRELRERSFGELEGAELPLLQEKFPNLSTDWREDLPLNIESLGHMQKRMVKELTNIMTNHQDEDVLVVSHGAAINVFIHYVTSGENGTGKILLANTAVSTFTFENRKWAIGTLNDASHWIKEAKSR